MRTINKNIKALGSYIPLLSKNIMRSVIVTTLIFVVIGMSTSYAQTNFSLFNNTPQQVNPSIIAHDSYARLIFNYRNQRVGEDVNFQSSLFSAAMPLVNKENHRWGAIGISFMDDRTDDDSFLNNQRLNINFAYNFQLSAIHNISVGAQGSWLSRKISTDGLTTGSQWVRNVGFDVSAPLGEQVLNNTVNAAGLSAGITWYMTDSDNNRIAYFGVSSYDINEPVTSFFDTDSNLPRSLSIHGGFRIVDNEKWSLAPELIVQRQSKLNFFNIGATASYKFKNDDPFHPITSGQLDFSARVIKDRGVGLGLQFVQRNFEVGVNYDIPSQSSQIDPLRSAFEFHIILKRKINKLKSPPPTVSNYSVGQVREFYENENTSDVEPEFKDNENTDSQSGNKPNDTDGNTAGSALKGNFRFELKKDFKFDFNDATIKEESKPYLEDMARILKENKLLKLDIIGHTDNIGTDVINLELSQKRAQAVYDYLVSSLGVQKLRLKAIGKGASEPLVENNSIKNRAKNRRVEFILYND